LLLNRFNINPSQAVFIDDNVRNIKGAEAAGIEGIQFESPQQLLSALIKKELL
jgi:2-haloacid dehalogenase